MPTDKEELKRKLQSEGKEACDVCLKYIQGWCRMSPKYYSVPCPILLEDVISTEGEEDKRGGRWEDRNTVALK